MFWKRTMYFSPRIALSSESGDAGIAYGAKPG